MGNRQTGSPAFLLGVALAAFSTLSLELLLTRIYSVTMYYHFAFMVVSLALLGLGVAGVTIYLVPWLARRPGVTAAAFMIAFAVSSLVALRVSIGNPLSLADWKHNLEKLPELYVAASLPFLASGFALSIAISSAGERIGRVYTFDLVGAALGCIFVIGALPRLGAQGAIAMTGALGAVSAVLFALSDPGGRIARWVLAAAAVVVALSTAYISMTERQARRFGLARNPEKFLGVREGVFEKWNAISQITVSELDDRNHLWIFIDGGAATRMWRGDTRDGGWKAQNTIPEVRVASLVYALNSKGPALIIGPGGGTDVISALSHGVPRVVGVEINPIIVRDVMKGRFADFSGRLYFDPRVRVVVDEGRSFVRRSDERYSSIQATLVDSWAASSAGAFTLSENNLYTVEAFEEFLDHLAPGGILAVTRWYFAGEPREFLRLVVLGRAALEKRGVPAGEVQRHFVIAVGSDSRGTLLLGRDPFSPALVQAAADMALEDQLGLVFVPYPVEGALRPIRKGQNSGGEDATIAAYLRSPSPEAFLARLPYDASPTTDDRPFFFCNARPGEMIRMLGHPGQVELNNMGLVVLLALLVIASVLTLLFVVLPLVLFRRDALSESRPAKLRILAYFLCLGLGFILVEIGFMQKFVLFLGHPIFALAVVLATLLVASGSGSALSGLGTRRWGASGLVRRVVVALALLLLAYAVGLGPLFRGLIGLPIGVRIVIAAILVGAPGLLMGTLLPSGIRTANSIGPAIVPWAWGLNGAASVVGSILAIFLSLSFGFSISLAVGVAVYIAAAVALPALSPPSARP